VGRQGRGYESCKADDWEQVRNFLHFKVSPEYFNVRPPFLEATYWPNVKCSNFAQKLLIFAPENSFLALASLFLSPKLPTGGKSFAHRLLTGQARIHNHKQSGI
jgi:hypothetical protein